MISSRARIAALLLRGEERSVRYQRNYLVFRECGVYLGAAISRNATEMLSEMLFDSTTLDIRWFARNAILPSFPSSWYNRRASRLLLLYLLRIRMFMFTFSLFPTNSERRTLRIPPPAPHPPYKFDGNRNSFEALTKIFITETWTIDATFAALTVKSFLVRLESVFQPYLESMNGADWICITNIIRIHKVKPFFFPENSISMLYRYRWQ